MDFWEKKSTLYAIRPNQWLFHNAWTALIQMVGAVISTKYENKYFTSSPETNERKIVNHIFVNLEQLLYFTLVSWFWLSFISFVCSSLQMFKGNYQLIGLFGSFLSAHMSNTESIGQANFRETKTNFKLNFHQFYKLFWLGFRCVCQIKDAKWLKLSRLLTLRALICAGSIYWC